MSKLSANARSRAAMSAAFAAATGVAIFTAASVLAQEQQPEPATELEKVEVTGSRISRVSFEGALPVTVINRADILATGKTTVTEALRALPFNTSGSYVQTSGNNFQGQAQVDVRGLGANRTIVLIDGHRLPISPVSTSSADLNTIPLAAVERIEILSDGASAIYGADAIGGVINIILRKDFVGGEVTVGAGYPTAEGASTEEASMVVGFSSGKTRSIVGGSYNFKDLIFLKDRDYSRADAGDGVNFSTTSGLSGYGNSVFNADFTQSFDAPDPGCPADRGFARYVDDSATFNNAGDHLCTFDFTTVAADTASIKAISLFAYTTHAIDNTWSVVFDMNYSRSESFGRFAPAPDFLFVPEEAVTNPYGQDINIAHRYAALGPRDTETQNDVIHVLGAVKGSFDRFSTETGLRLFRYNSNEFGRNFVLNSVAASLAESGDYNPLDVANPGSEDVLNSMRITINRDGYSDVREAFAYVDVPDVFRLSAGPVGTAFGAEYREEEFADIYDSQQEAGTVGGTAGNSSSGERTAYAVFGEALIPILSSLEIGVAARYDDYDDVGGEFSPKISTRWTPISMLTTRASYGQGFRAPLLSELNANDAFSAETVRDLVQCQANGVPLETCPEVQRDTFFIANNNLKPETSDQFSAGIVVQPLHWLDASVDYYNITINDSIITPAPQSLILRELAGQTLPEGSSITRLPGGAIDFINSQTLNIAEIKTDGLDFSLNTRFRLGAWGHLRSGLSLSYVLGFTEDDGASPVQDQVGNARVGTSSAVPEYRAVLQTNWTWKTISATWYISHIAATAETQLPQEDNPILLQQVGHSPSNTVHDFQLKYGFPWRGDIIVGVKDAFDRGVNVNRTLGNPFYDQELYDPTGRMPYFRYLQRF
jgi:iron complex outermembrane receptor protein